MERKIKEVFDYDGVSLKVVKEKDTTPDLCYGCYFLTKNGFCKRKTRIAGYCSDDMRTDETNVIFMLNNIRKNSK